MTTDSETVIISLHPVPPTCGLAVLSIWMDEEGWFEGGMESLLLLALVETRYYHHAVRELPGDPTARRAYRSATVRTIEPVIYDGDSLTGLSPLSELVVTDNERLTIVKTDLSWECLMEELVFASHTLPRKKSLRRMAEAASS